MASVQINSKIKVGFDELLQGLSSLETVDIERFMKELGVVLAKRKAPNFSKRETELLIKINQGWAVEKQARYDVLAEKLRKETISEKEHKELLQLSDESEGMDVERLRNLIELSQLRKVSLDTLMLQLGLTPSAHA